MPSDSSSSRLRSFAAAAAAEGGFGEAAYLLQKATDIAGPDADLEEARATYLLETGRAEEALRAIEYALRHGVTPYRSLIRAAALAELGKIDDALPVVREITAHLWDDPVALVFASQLELKAGNLESAWEVGERCVLIAPSYVLGYVACADALAARGKHEEAIRYLREAVGLDPDNPAIRTALGAELIEAGHRKEGQEYLVDVVARTPDYEAAADALILSAAPNRPRSRRWTLLVMLGLPAGIYLAVFGLLLALGWTANAAVIGAFAGMFGTTAIVTVLLRIQQRSKASPEARQWIRHLLWRSSVRAVTPPDRLVPALALLGVPWLALSIWAGASTGPAAVLFLVTLYIILAGIVFWIRWRRHMRYAGPPTRAQVFDAAVCHCQSRRKLFGEDADKYIELHLTGQTHVLEGIDVFRCPVTSTRWLSLVGVPGIEGTRLFQIAEELEEASPYTAGYL